jgi:hypothetical protein
MGVRKVMPPMNFVVTMLAQLPLRIAT